MNLTPYFKSIIDQDVASVVICNLKHEIIYMNPKAVESYHKWGGEALLGKSLMNCHNPKSKEIIEKVVAWFEEHAGKTGIPAEVAALKKVSEEDNPVVVIME